MAQVIWDEVEEDGHAVVEAGPADAPLVDERDGILLGLRGRVAPGLTWV